MAVVAASPAPDWLRRVARLQVLTIAWMTIEGKCQSKYTVDRLIRSQRDFTT